MTKFILPLTVCLLALFTACQKIEITDQTDDKKTEEKTDTDETIADTTHYYTVTTLNEADDDAQVGLKCYIVGYTRGSSIKSTVFSAEDAVATNLVVADSRNETDYEQCAAVQLKKDTNARKQLNLCDHPEMLHSHVLLIGTKSEYCQATGLKNIKEFRILEDDEENDDDDSNDNENDSTLQKTFPTLSTDNADAFEGA